MKHGKDGCESLAPDGFYTCTSISIWIIDLSHSLEAFTKYFNRQGKLIHFDWRMKFCIVNGNLLSFGWRLCINRDIPLMN